MVLAAVNGEKLTFCAACGKDALSKGAHAGNLVREVARQPAATAAESPTCNGGR
ncbi:MAG: hypothetical protein ACLR56_01295 [Oscillospiraceae bacterium]